MTNRSFEGLNMTLGALHLSLPTMVSEADSLTTAASALIDGGASCAPVARAAAAGWSPSPAWSERWLGAAPRGRGRCRRVRETELGPPSASVAEAAALIASLGIRHLVALDMLERPRGLVSIEELFDVPVRAQDPMAHFARFADIMLHRTEKPVGHEPAGRESKAK